jgi:hypothetical protein
MVILLFFLSFPEVFEHWKKVKKESPAVCQNRVRHGAQYFFLDLNIFNASPQKIKNINDATDIIVPRFILLHYIDLNNPCCLFQTKIIHS